MFELKVTKVGNSSAVILPKELLALLDVGVGAKLYATRCKDGVQLSAFDSEVAADVKLGLQIMDEYRDVLRELAK